MTSTDHNAVNAITAQLVPDEARLETLPRHFGRYMLTVENMVYQFAGQLVTEYRGGYWRFYELSNGGFYMAPDSKPARVYVDGNGFGGEMSADAIGITVCLFTFSHDSFRYPDDTFARHYQLLREFACFHPEAALIAAAID